MPIPSGSARSRRPHPREQITADLMAECLEAAGTTYDADELAYYVLTSQVENPVRDRFAFELHRRIRSTNLLVGREWTGMRSEGSKQRRVDVAVVDRGGTQEALIEFKAFRTYEVDTPARARTKMSKVRKDIEKSLDESGMVSKTFAIVLLSHGFTPVPSIMKARRGFPVIKDFTKVVQFEPPHESTARRERANALVERWLSRVGEVHRGTLDAGTEFDTHITVDYLIAGPVPEEWWTNPIESD